MRKFLIKVNGSEYEVEVEEIRDGSVEYRPETIRPAQPAPVEAPKAAAPAAKPKAEPKAVAAGPEGATKINAPMPGVILDIKVNSGDTVKKGDVLLILEAMKMENEILAPADGKIASINTSKGASVNAGDVLLTMS